LNFLKEVKHKYMIGTWETSDIVRSFILQHADWIFHILTLYHQRCKTW
jgi:hypothetical protein